MTDFVTHEQCAEAKREFREAFAAVHKKLASIEATLAGMSAILTKIDLSVGRHNGQIEELGRRQAESRGGLRMGAWMVGLLIGALGVLLGLLKVLGARLVVQ